MKNILFVCTGNTCRSPMAESIMKHLLKEKNIKDVEVSSCGICAVIGQPMSENAQKALEKLQITPHEHKSKPFLDTYYEQYNIILTMTKDQKQALHNRKNVYAISEITGVNDIADPFGQNEESYVLTASMLLKACKILLDTIK